MLANGEDICLPEGGGQTLPKWQQNWQFLLASMLEQVTEAGQKVSKTTTACCLDLISEVAGSESQQYVAQPPLGPHGGTV